MQSDEFSGPNDPRGDARAMDGFRERIRQKAREMAERLGRTQQSSSPWQSPALDARREPKREPPAWRKLLDQLDTPQTTEPRYDARREVQGEIIYVLEVAQSREQGVGILAAYRRTMKANGSPGKWKPFGISNEVPGRVTDPIDRTITAYLVGLTYRGGSRYYSSYYSYGSQSSWTVDADAIRGILPSLIASGRLMFRGAPDDEPRTLRYDDGSPWELTISLSEKTANSFELSLGVARGERRLPMNDVALMLDGKPGLCIIDDTLAGLESFGCDITLFRRHSKRAMTIPGREANRLVNDLTAMTAAPRLELPGEWALSPVHDLPPTGQLELTLGDQRIIGELSYQYDGVAVPGIRAASSIIDAAGHRQIFRDRAAEAVLAQRMQQLGFREDSWQGKWGLPSRKLPEIVKHLSAEGWVILADGRLFRRAGEVEISVTSGIDWFDVDGKVDFEGVGVSLPELLKAARMKSQFVRLDDGSLGMLPEAWLEKHGKLLGLGEAEGDNLRFNRTQVLLLDALLAEQSQVRVDAAFAELRDRLHGFEGVRPIDAPPVFVGSLRPYQQHGLGWMKFLDEFGWGGCLADDMGLGKTVQVLAWLAARGNGAAVGAAASAVAATNGKNGRNGSGNGKRSGRAEAVGDAVGKVHASSTEVGMAQSTVALPSLVVVPRSVVFNWMDEARRFVPGLRIHAHHGAGRHEAFASFDQFDLIVTTYHTLRNDIADFTQREFDYVILDEAQSIKNAKAQIAKAVRLIKGRRRLALSGTPIENRLSDLWSLFEFLNPGMLGVVSAFQAAFGAGEASKDGVAALRRALRPFLLRRTKEAVAPELPAKTEETIQCEMTATQAKRYDELRTYYRASVLGKVEKDGLAKSKIHVLEALLRLRQTACHPALLDEKIDAADAGKIDALMPMLNDVIAGGHKALVFSQFTSFLAILRKLLDKEGIAYLYLDGQTRDRGALVKRFQTDAEPRLFLISLKAGGLGLNLTAADYVFILDPWWNPAVEAQAIDRTHRIGQDKKVIAYRMIAKGTVEEKILDLQAKKRDLATSIITEANSLISELTREDLEVLLS